MKKTIKLVIVAALMLSFCTVQAFAVGHVELPEGSTSHNIKVQGIPWDGAGEVVSELGATAFDPAWVTTADFTSYNEHLSVWACTLAADAYNETTTWIDGTSTNCEENKNFDTFLNAYGFGDVKREFVESTNNKDKNDVAKITMAHRLWTVDGKQYDTFILAVSGTDKTKAQWISDLDVGADTYGYSVNMDTEHPEWTTKSNHKGFDVAATRVDKALAAYMAQYEVSGIPKTLLLVGHSRGAAISNILGAAYEGSSTTPSVNVGAYGSQPAQETFAVTSQAYTFNTPSTSTSKDLGRKTVYNLINGDDLFTASSISVWGFGHYGTDMMQSIKSSTKLSSIVTSYQNGTAYAAASNLASYDKIFLEIAPTREALYDTYFDTFTFDASLASTARNHCDKVIKAAETLEATDYIKITIKKSGLHYSVEKKVKPAFELMLVANLASCAGQSDPVNSMLSLANNVLTVFNDGGLSVNEVSYMTTKLVTQMAGDIEGLFGAHMDISSYVLARYHYSSFYNNEIAADGTVVPYTFIDTKTMTASGGAQ